MKHKKTLVAYIIVALYIFIRIFITLYNDTKELSKKDGFKEEIIVELKEHPEKMKKELGISSESELTDEMVNNIYSLSQRYRYVFIIVISLSVSAIGATLLFIPVFIFLSVRKKYYKYRISNDEFNKERDYYRDLLVGYTPLELSYNNNYQIDDYAIIATILNLENKKIIEYRDNKFYLKKKDNLSIVEKNITSCISDNGTKKLSVSKSSLYMDTMNICKDKGLIKLGNISRKKFFRDLVISILIYVIIYLIYSKSDFLLNNSTIEKSYILSTAMPFIGLALILFVYVYPVFFVIRYFILFFITGIKNYHKTALGNEINNKLEGLKNFIRDFSMLNEREKKEIILWNDYLVYSVMFGDNSKIMDKYQDIVKINI